MSNKIKVAIPLYGSSSWTAGLTYFQNLNSAVTAFSDSVELCFVSIPEEEAKSFFRTGFNEIKNRLVGTDQHFEDLIKSVNPDCVFSMGYKHIRNIPFISWIPDFQHLHLPQMFSRKELLTRNYVLGLAAKKADLIVLSSENARNDFLKFAPKYSNKAHVLHFTASVPKEVFESDSKEIVSRYNLPERFFYLPNQFWKHKNHITAFKAVKELKLKGIEVCLVCTGNTTDYRNPAFYQELLDFIKYNNLQENIRILGMVDHSDVYRLIRQSIAVINPSLFEGWSTTVEETKSIGKSMILSDIEVHREQISPNTEYFIPEDISSLMDKIMKFSDQDVFGPDIDMEKEAQIIKHDNQIRFATLFSKIIQLTLNDSSI